MSEPVRQQPPRVAIDGRPVSTRLVAAAIAQ
jgi:hypothetical protein